MFVPLTINDFLERGAAVHGARPGVVDEPDPPGGGLGTVTYAGLRELARAQAARLDELGLPRGARIAVVSQNAARLLTSFFGVSGYGRVLVPINFRLSAEEISYIVGHSGASMLLVDPEVADTCAGIDVPHRIVLDANGDDALYRRGTDPEPWNADESATATINYTSGTTARPKGVQLTHRSLWLNAALMGWHAGVTERDVYLHTLPMFHANGWGLPFTAAGMGVPQIVLRKVDGAEILRRIEEHGVTLLCAAPAVVAATLEAAATWEGPIPGAGRTRVVVAGAPPPTTTIARIETELGWEFIHLYGLTETSPLLTMHRSRPEYDGLTPDQRAAVLVKQGPPAVGVTLAIDREGEILARSNVVLEGYWEQPEVTAEALEGGWFHTGDGGELDDEGRLSIKDRRKDVIITGGENVSSIEVEDALFSHPDVAEVAVIGVPDERWGETVKALVVLAGPSPADEAELIAWCRARLAHYKCPTTVEVRDELPRTATGKLQKFKLRAPYWEGRVTQVN